MRNHVYRVYARLEPGALLVRQASARTLSATLLKAASLIKTAQWEIREVCGGKERPIYVEEVRYQ